MADQLERTEAALHAARLYYLERVTMEAIARDLGVSRSSVSRMLERARETGLVDIRIRPPHDTAALESVIGRRHRIRVRVVTRDEPTDETAVHERVAMVAAQHIGDLMHAGAVVGVAWGSTVDAVSRHLPPRRHDDSVIVQLNGSGNIVDSGIGYTSEILSRFGTAFGARVEQFPVPAFFDDPRARAMIWRERSTRRILALHARMDIAVFGIGTPLAEVRSHVYSGGYLDARDYATLRAQRVAGDVATVFYRTDGSHDGIALNARTSGPDPELLRRVPRRVCVVSGLARHAGLRGALAAGLITDLVLDEQLARALVGAG